MKGDDGVRVSFCKMGSLTMKESDSKENHNKEVIIAIIINNVEI
jgi:hypothetical protein